MVVAKNVIVYAGATDTALFTATAATVTDSAYVSRRVEGLFFFAIPRHWHRTQDGLLDGAHSLMRHRSSAMGNAFP